MMFEQRLMDHSFTSPVIIYDGVCMLCNKSIQWVLKNDKQHIFYFSTIQSSFNDDKSANHINSVILLYRGKTYAKSQAVLMILKILGGFYSFVSIPAKIIPKFFLDYIYDIIAKNRYKWFGKSDQCIIPSDGMKNRFL